MIKTSLLALALVSMCSVTYAADATIKADAQNIDSACASEAATAGCGNEKVGTGMLKCIWNYKRQNKKSFQISAGCKAAMQQMRADKKAGK